MPNPVFTYIEYMICKHVFLDTQVKWSNSSISNNSSEHKSTKLNGPKLCYVSQTIQLNIIHLLTHNKMN